MTARTIAPMPQKSNPRLTSKSPDYNVQRGAGPQQPDDWPDEGIRVANKKCDRSDCPPAGGPAQKGHPLHAVERAAQLSRRPRVCQSHPIRPPAPHRWGLPYPLSSVLISSPPVSCYEGSDRELHQVERPLVLASIRTYSSTKQFERGCFESALSGIERYLRVLTGSWHN